MPNFIEIKETLWTTGRTHVHTYWYLRTALLGRLCWRVDLKIWCSVIYPGSASLHNDVHIIISTRHLC